MVKWTEERRKKQAEAIRRWKPWEKSTGPRTEAGKTRSKLNAYKGVLTREAEKLISLNDAFLRQAAIVELVERLPARLMRELLKGEKIQGSDLEK